MAGLVSMGTKGFNFGIDFKGGQSWEVSAPSSISAATVQSAVQSAGAVSYTHLDVYKRQR